MMKLSKAVAVLLLCFVFFSVSSVTCFGAEVQFSLSDTDTKKNRLFDVTLSAENSKGVSAFVCELEYDPTAIEYKAFSLNIENADAQVNSLEEGRLKAVFLCEESVSKEDKTSLITFSFKALKAEEHTINLSVYDCINDEYENVEAVCTPCVVSVAQIPLRDSSYSDKGVLHNSESSESDSISEGSADEEKLGYTKINSNDNNRFIIFGVLLGFCLLAIVGFVCYKLGAKRKKVNNEK